MGQPVLLADLVSPIRPISSLPFFLPQTSPLQEHEAELVFEKINKKFDLSSLLFPFPSP